MIGSPHLLFAFLVFLYYGVSCLSWSQVYNLCDNTDHKFSSWTQSPSTVLNTEYNPLKNSWCQSVKEGIVLSIVLIPQHFLSCILLIAQLIILENLTICIIIKDVLSCAKIIWKSNSIYTWRICMEWYTIYNNSIPAIIQWTLYGFISTSQWL